MPPRMSPTFLRWRHVTASPLARNHPCNDGNKRIAFIASLTFLLLHGWRVVADQGAAAAIVLDVAAGATGQDGYAAWLRDHAQSRS